MAKPAPIDGVDGETELGLAARRALAVRLSEVRVLEERVKSQRDADGVHDLRVATRRLRAALGLFGRGNKLGEAAAEVKRLGRALGEVRDLDVQVGWLERTLESGTLIDTEPPGVRALLTQRRAELPDVERELHQALDRWIDTVAPRLEKTFASVTGDGVLGGRRMRRTLDRRLRRLKRQLSDVLDSPDARAAHRLRITVKKLRYDTELLEAALPTAAPAVLTALVPLQETLGELHDRDVRLPIIERFLRRAEPAEQPGAVRLLNDELGHRDRLAAELTLELKAWKADKTVGNLRRALD